jgi:copper chaperone CopZ|tara:strand:- start:1253 stop:1735 length:483 start_codon:yes stop_codon:yes gene_type:complete
MTKRLEEEFNLPPIEEVTEKAEVVEQEVVELPATKQEVDDALDLAERINEALPQVKGLTTADVELDDIATKALESYEELMRLGMNVQDVHAGRIFDNAANMLKVALDSKSTKIDKKLKMVDLQLKRQKLDQDLDPEQANNPNQQIFNRNDLLKFINKDDK